MDIVIRVGISRLQREDGRVGRSVELDDGLHRQRPVDEIRRLVIHILHLDDDALIVRVCIELETIFSYISRIDYHVMLSRESWA